MQGKPESGGNAFLTQAYTNEQPTGSGHNRGILNSLAVRPSLTPPSRLPTLALMPFPVQRCLGSALFSELCET